MLIGVVGPCGSGKTTLVTHLVALGIRARSIAQEHSYVPDMWQRLTHPDILVYLHVSYPLTLVRRRLDWTPAEYMEQIHRLRHARAAANLVIDTDSLSPEQVKDRVLEYLTCETRFLLII